MTKNKEKVINIHIPSDLQELIDWEISVGRFCNERNFAAAALQHFYEQEQALRDVLEAEQEIRDGKGITGDLRTIVETLDY